MKSRIGFLLVFIALCTSLPATEIQLTDSSVLRFASLQEGSDMLASRDEYIVLMSPFDRAARMHSRTAVSEEDMLEYLSKQTLQWTDVEIEMFTEIVSNIRTELKKYQLNFPPTVLLLKTTSKDEGGAEVAYTRQNAIMFTTKILQNKNEMLRSIFIHELFHIFSRHNPQLQEKLYNLIGFQRCNPIQLPESLAIRKLTNPDAPRNDNYIEVSYKEERVTVVPFIYARESVYDPNRGTNIFDFLEFKLLRVQKQAGMWQPVLNSKEAVLYGIREVDGLFDQIGNNTQYIIHPEEILADNFMYMITEKSDLPTPRIIDSMKRILEVR